MRLTDIIRFSISNLSQRGLRSWLTILGIVIGVAAVVSIISIGTGMQQTISNQLGGLGSDIGYILPGFERASRGNQRMMMTPMIGATRITLTDKDIQTVKNIPGIKTVNGIIAGRVDVEYYGENMSVQMYGVDPIAMQVISVAKVEQGRKLAPGDGNVVVIGHMVANEMFKKPISLNSQISINGKSFRVVGILERYGGMVGGIIYDNAVFMTTNVGRTVLTSIGSNEFSVIQFKVNDLNQLDYIVEEVESKLMNLRHVTQDTKDFTIITAKSMQQTISSVLMTLNMFLGGIAAISLLVGAIGIANTMYMSVIERTRQIGTLKALGATNTEVMKMFVIESSLIGLLGGLIGVFLGFISSGVISELGIRMVDMQMRAGASISVITPELVLFSIAFSVAIGAVSGLLPARKAALLEPVEALRYE